MLCKRLSETTTKPTTDEAHEAAAHRDRLPPQAQKSPKAVRRVKKTLTTMLTSLSNEWIIYYRLLRMFLDVFLYRN